MTRQRARRIVAVVMSIFLLPLAVALAYLVTDEPGSDARAYLDCRPFERPRSVEQINRFIATERSTPGFAGGDVGASTLLADGRTLWVFGDTLRSGGPMVRNSMLLMGDGCASVYRPADGGAAVPDRDDGVGYWPTTVASVPDAAGGTRVAVGLMRVRPTGAGMWDFEIVGSSVARFAVPANDVPRLEGVTDLDPDESDPRRPLWGAASTVEGDRVYVYGTATTGEELVFGYSLHVARTTVAGYLSQENWQYWDGTGWTSDASRAAELVPAESGVSRALTVFERDGSWYAVSKRHDYLGSDLVIWKAPAPTGPFVPSEPLLEIPTDDAWMKYMPLAHPELLPRPGSVVVSWSVNSLDPTVVERDPEAYRPQFTRVPLP